MKLAGPGGWSYSSPVIAGWDP